jgi:hypothetical protein
MLLGCRDKFKYIWEEVEGLGGGMTYFYAKGIVPHKNVDVMKEAIKINQ